MPGIELDPPGLKLGIGEVPDGDRRPAKPPHRFIAFHVHEPCILTVN